MKTAISISTRLFSNAEQVAQRMRLSRSALYCLALAEFIKAHQSDNVTQALNKVYQDESQPLDSALMAAQVKVLAQEEW